MKQLFIALFLLVSGGLFSQDISKMLQNGKWYATSDPNGKITYAKKAKEKDTPSYVFKEDGKVVHCGITTENSLDANGKEAKTGPMMRCDSVWHYEVKNGMLKMQLLKQNPNYYKLAFMGESVELTPGKEEDYK